MSRKSTRSSNHNDESFSDKNIYDALVSTFDEHKSAIELDWYLNNLRKIRLAEHAI